VRAYRKALNIDPNNAIVYQYIGAALIKLGKNKEAVYNYKNAI